MNAASDAAEGKAAGGGKAAPAKKPAGKTTAKPAPENILLTGSTGLVGSHIAEALDGPGLRCGLRKTSSEKWLQKVGAERREFDLLDRDTWLPAMQGCKVVIHCAGVTRVRRRREFYDSNATAAGELAAAAAQAGVRRFVLISSLAARGTDGVEQDAPNSDYGRSKLQGEQQVLAAAGDMEVISLRLGAVYGPRDTDNFQLLQMAARGLLLLPRTDSRIQPVYAPDVAEAVRLALGVAQPPADPVYVCQWESLDWAQMGQMMCQQFPGRRVRVVRVPAWVFLAAAAGSELGAGLLGRAPQLDRRRARDVAVYSYTVDPQRAQEQIGFRAAHDLNEGMRETMAWYLEQGWI